jgi:cytidyltransferase-like protein
MNQLVKELIQPLLEAQDKLVALYPGKFKPPHKGHFEVVKGLLDLADEVIVVISPLTKDGVDAKQSEAVWNLYKTLLGNKLNIVVAPSSPVSYVYDIIKNNPEDNFIVAYGKGEESRYKSLTKNPKVQIIDGGTVSDEGGNINATDLRNALQTGQNISRFLPIGIKQQDFIKAVAAGTIEEDMSKSDLKSVEKYADKELSPIDVDFSSHFFDRLNDPRNIKPISPAELIGFFKRLAREKDKLENFLTKYRQVVASDNRTNINIPLVKATDKIIAKTIMRKQDFQTSDPKLELKENFNQPLDFKTALVALTKHMLDQGLNIKPLPKLKIINNDVENANNILGRTAFYNPEECSITLYTLNRHPKDILRSYAHEMIHRIQDNEGRLNNVHTTNTNEDDNLQELEKEAYLNGNIIFRNWEDSIKNV